MRGRGYIRSIKDLESIGVGMNGGTPIMLGACPRSRLDRTCAAGLAELDGRGEVVGGVVVMRYGENALKVIERVKEKIKEITPSLPPSGS